MEIGHVAKENMVSDSEGGGGGGGGGVRKQI